MPTGFRQVLVRLEGEINDFTQKNNARSTICRRCTGWDCTGFARCFLGAKTAGGPKAVFSKVLIRVQKAAAVTGLVFRV